jgi:hypothetical protein
MTDIPILMTSQGAQPQPPATLRAVLLAKVAATNPGYTANLPGSLIEDVSSTEVAGLSLIDAARVDQINSITPYAANQFIMNQQGQLYGVRKGLPTNTSVYVVFTGTPGFTIGVGFTVSDGTHQYTVQNGGIVGGGGATQPLFCSATQAGTWAVPANTVTTLITSVPSPYTLSVNNPATGTPGDPNGESESSYRSRLDQAAQAVAQGLPTFLKTQIGNVVGVQSRLISVRPGSVSGTWEVLVGGGDPYEVAYAIYRGVLNVTTLVGSSHTERNVTKGVISYPDVYQVTFVVPVAQVVDINVVWGTTAENIVSATAVAQQASAALADYVNGIQVGQYMNLYELQSVFQVAVASAVPPALLTKINFTVYVDGIIVPPTVGTGIIAGDSEGYFTTSASNISVLQG